jgi:hypothetical protein
MQRNKTNPTINPRKNSIHKSPIKTIKYIVTIPTIQPQIKLIKTSIITP